LKNVFTLIQQIGIATRIKNLGRLAAVKRVEMDSGWKMKLQLQIPSSFEFET
jgi:hypothetical protein